MGNNGNKTATYCNNSMHMFFQCFSMVLAFSGGAAREDQDVHFIFKAFFWQM